MGFGLTDWACELLFCLLFWVGCRKNFFFPQQRDHITIYSHQIYSHSGVKTSSLETAGECCQWLKEQSGKVHVCELGFLKLLRICCRKDSEATLREHATSAVLCLVKRVDQCLQKCFQIGSSQCPAPIRSKPHSLGELNEICLIS